MFLVCCSNKVSYIVVILIKEKEGERGIFVYKISSFFEAFNKCIPCMLERVSWKYACFQ